MALGRFFKEAIEKGLDMSGAGRLSRAREQGYGDPMYRGVTRETPGLEAREGMLGRGVYLTDSPSAASQFAEGRVIGRSGDAPNVMQLKTNARDIFDYDGATKADEIRILEANGIDASDVKAIPDDEYLFDRDYLFNGVFEGQDPADVLQAAGYDAATAKEAFDVGGVRTGQEYQSQVVFDPANIRSVNAAFDPENIGKPDLMGALSGAAPTLAAGALAAGALMPEDAEAGILTKGGKRLIEAWHGSPHKFDRFSMDAIGTGEGAQAYGHGLYFADAEDVARGYRDALSAPRYDFSRYKPTPSGKAELSKRMDSKLNEVVDDVDHPYWNGWHDSGEVVDETNAGVRKDWLKNETDAERDFEPDLIKEMGLEDDGVNEWFSVGEGALYRTHIDVDPDNLLDYDAPLSEQSEYVRGRLQSLGIEIPEKPKPATLIDNLNGEYAVQLPSGHVTQNYPDKASAEDVIRRTNEMHERHYKGSQQYGFDLLNQLGGNRAGTSANLNSAGIPGIRYKDQFSRNQAPDLPDYDTWRGYNRGGAEDSPQLRQEYATEQQKAADFASGGTSNYVIFDDKLIDIKERGSATPGILGATAAGSGAALGLMPEQDAAAEMNRRLQQGRDNYGAAMGVLSEDGPMSYEGTLAAPQHPNVLRAANALHGLSRRLEGSPMGMLAPDATANWLGKLAYQQEPTWEDRFGVLMDWF